MKRELQCRQRDLFDQVLPIPVLPDAEALQILVATLLGEIVTVTAKTREACDDKDHA